MYVLNLKQKLKDMCSVSMEPLVYTRSIIPIVNETLTSTTTIWILLMTNTLSLSGCETYT